MKTVIEMAREANLPACHTTHSKALERFATLVRADEREALAQPEQRLKQVAHVYLLDQRGWPQVGWDDGRGIKVGDKLYTLTSAEELLAELISAPENVSIPQPEERYFCPRCGKRTADPTTIHTCTPPQIASDKEGFYGLPQESVSSSNAGGKCVTAGETAPTPATCHHSQANSALIAKLEAYERQTGNSQGLGKP